MKNATSKFHSLLVRDSQTTLAEVLRAGAQRMLITALEAEVATYVEAFVGHRDKDGRRLVVRNGHHRARTLDTGVGAVEVAAPRVNDRRVDDEGNRQQFTSKILSPYLRRTRSLE